MHPARVIVLASLVCACTTVGMTGRRQLILVSEADEMQMGLTSFQEVKAKQKLSTDAAQLAEVKRVGERIARIAKRPDFQWEFVVVDDPKTVNAFCLPGGKVAVYSGLLPVSKDDAGLAVVLGHEVAHALARHGAERVSESMLTKYGQDALMAGVGKRDPAVLQGLATAYGVGTQVGLALPHSRDQESEADHIGLMLMARAGYEPKTAIAFWQRMEAANGPGTTPEFLSTHPADARRVTQLQGWMAEAERAYAAAPK
jgi:predicted Zn-dependent protease